MTETETLLDQTNTVKSGPELVDSGPAPIGVSTDTAKTDLPPDTKQPNEAAALIDLTREIRGKPSVLAIARAEPEIIVPKPLETYIADFRGFSKSTALSTIQMCRVVYEAQATLGREKFDKFLKEVGLQASLATVTKFVCIGRAHDRLLPHVDKLPSNWTSLYRSR